MLKKASERKLEGPFMSALRFDIAFRKGDSAGMQREVASVQGKPGFEDWLADRQASALATSSSLLTAMIVFDVCMPARCWIAPEMPSAMYSCGDTVLPVWPTWNWPG